MPLAVALFPALFVTCAVVLAIIVEMSTTVIIGLAVLSASLLFGGGTLASSNQARKRTVVAGWGGTMLAISGFALTQSTVMFDDYYAVLAGLVAVAVLTAAFGIADLEIKSKWRKLGLTWAFLGSSVWIGASCLQNRQDEFYAALLVNLTLLILCRLWFRPRAFGIQTLNSLILLLVALPAFDLLLRSRSTMDMKSEPQKYYPYEAAKRDPTAYALYTRYYGEQWASMAKDIMEPDPKAVLPFLLRPGSRGTFFQSLIEINSRGFRGPEIPSEKGNAYRIVALGESTTFGITLMREDRPWPDLLEQMIRERLKPARPVEVINAGVPAYDLQSNLGRLFRQILPLKPDMIISYHGLNGFRMIDGTLRPAYAKPPPAYQDRPLKFLADFEFALKLASYKRHLVQKVVPDLPVNNDPLNSEYARAYTRLINIARTNHIRLVLANFSMAVNEGSEPAIIEFYRASNPQVKSQIKANVAHTLIVQQLAAQHPEVIFVDTHPEFDGEHGKFIDLVHLTQPGRQHLAETFFTSIKKTLEEDLDSQKTPIP